MWRAVSAAAVSTYAFVNPVLAVFLGWLIAREPMGPGVFVAAAMIVAAVVLIQSTSWVRKVAKPLPRGRRLGVVDGAA